MSHAKHSRRRERKKARSPEAKSIATKIRRGIFPAFFLAKAAEGSNQLERDKKGRLTMRQIGTMKSLMTLPEVKKNEDPIDQPTPEVPDSA